MSSLLTEIIPDKTGPEDCEKNNLQHFHETRSDEARERKREREREREKERENEAHRDIHLKFFLTRVTNQIR